MAKHSSISFTCYGMFTPPDLLALVSILGHVQKVERLRSSKMENKLTAPLPDINKFSIFFITVNKYNVFMLASRFFEIKFPSAC